MINSFVFQDPGVLQDDELSLVLYKTLLADPLRENMPSYFFHIIVSGKEVGDIRFRARTSPALEFIGGHIGYDIYEPYRGNHYSERASRLLFNFARQHGFTELWLTCNSSNWPSRRTCERLGAAFMGIVKVPETHFMFANGEFEKCRYRIGLSS